MANRCRSRTERHRHSAQCAGCAALRIRWRTPALRSRRAISGAHPSALRPPHDLRDRSLRILTGRGRRQIGRSYVTAHAGSIGLPPAEGGSTGEGLGSLCRRRRNQTGWRNRYEQSGECPGVLVLLHWDFLRCGHHRDPSARQRIVPSSTTRHARALIGSHSTGASPGARHARNAPLLQAVSLHRRTGCTRSAT